MDFHSLSRKELQALCKKNKIPANMTNVAMADALRAVEKVEGLDELTNATKSDPRQQSPKKIMPGLLDMPRTVSRTSTRRKPFNLEPDSSLPMTGTRCATRRTATEEADQENKNVNLPETPAMPVSRRRAPAASARRKEVTQVMESGETCKHEDQEKNDVLETPAMQSSRRRAPAVSACKKTEAQKEEKSVQRVYGTRHSARLLEKSMAGLSLKEKGRVENVEIKELCKETEEVEQKKFVSGADLLALSEESLESNNDSEVLSCRNLDQSLGNETEMSHELKDDKKSDDYKMNDCNVKIETNSEKYNNLDNLAGLDAEDDDNHKSSDELNPVQPENSGKAVDMHHESIDDNGPSILIPVDSETLDAGLNSEVAKDFNGYQDPLFVDVSNDSSTFILESDHNSTVKVPDEVSAEALDHVLAAQFTPPHENNYLVNIEEFVAADPPTPRLSEFVGECSEINLTGNEQYGNQNFQSKSAIQEQADDTQSAEVQENNNSETVEKKVPLLLEDACYEESESTNESESLNFISRHEICEEVLDHLVSELYVPNELPDDSLTDNSMVPLKELLDKCNTEVLVDVDVIESVEFDMMAHGCYTSLDSDKSPLSIKQRSPCCPLGSDGEAIGEIPLLKMQEYGNFENLVDVHVMPAEEFAMAAYECCPTLDKTPATKQMNPCQLPVSGGHVTHEIVFSPFPANTLYGQFPHPNVAYAADVNKENVDNSCREIEPKIDKVEKKVIDAEISDDISLRKLTKMLKEKLQIVNKKNEEKNVNKIEQQIKKARMALQALPENCMPAVETKNKV